MAWEEINGEEPEINAQELEAWREATEVSDAAVAALQARVMAQVAVPKSRLPWWKWAVPVAAVAILVTVVVTRPDSAPPAERSLPKAPAVFVPVEVPPAPEAPLEVPKVTQHVRRKPLLQEAVRQEASYIRYETPDPDVVILLIGSDGGGE